jgi:RimJ/RimL family protein N-acetyltransferase
MELRPISIDDLQLYERIHCDPVMWEHLGGPRPREGLAEKVGRDAAATEADEVWVFKIIPDDGADAAGTVSIWEHSWEGQSINEIGWMVLPEFQGRGVGSEAVRAVLQKARSESRWDVVHAFPAITNAPSNAICRKLGFSKLEERVIERERILRCNHWRLDLRSAGPS